VRSPFLNVNRACQTCHKWSEEALKAQGQLALREARPR
jgi:nitrite reductase (cytochrome c-552)